MSRVGYHHPLMIQVTRVLSVCLSQQCLETGNSNHPRNHMISVRIILTIYLIDIVDIDIDMMKLMLPEIANWRGPSHPSEQ